jgi:hypothetical protein
MLIDAFNLYQLVTLVVEWTMEMVIITGMRTVLVTRTVIAWGMRLMPVVLGSGRLLGQIGPPITLNNFVDI